MTFGDDTFLSPGTYSVFLLQDERYTRIAETSITVSSAMCSLGSWSQCNGGRGCCATSSYSCFRYNPSSEYASCYPESYITSYYASPPAAGDWRGCYTGNGADYVGSVSTTISGYTCQDWSLDTPHAHSDNHLPGNYCRNPTGYSGGPWCYTTSTARRWEYCSQIPQCTPPAPPALPPFPPMSAATYELVQGRSSCTTAILTASQCQYAAMQLGLTQTGGAALVPILDDSSSGATPTDALLVGTQPHNRPPNCYYVPSGDPLRSPPPPRPPTPSPPPPYWQRPPPNPSPPPPYYLTGDIAPPQSPPSMCDNSCYQYNYNHDTYDPNFARSWNNVCEDGGPSSVSSECALGTDCQDCGPREGLGSPPPPPAPRPPPWNMRPPPNPSPPPPVPWPPNGIPPPPALPWEYDVQVLTTGGTLYYNPSTLSSGAASTNTGECPGGVQETGSSGGSCECVENCAYSSDGNCDDGGSGSEYSICSVGNDCIDCGPRCTGGGALLSVTSGSAYCSIDNSGCVTDGVGNHGNNERCTITATQAITVSATYFMTESYYDRISIGSSRWSGTTGPLNVAMAAGSTMTWYSDGSVIRGGFTICASAVGGSSSAVSSSSAPSGPNWGAYCLCASEMPPPSPPNPSPPPPSPPSPPAPPSTPPSPPNYYGTLTEGSCTELVASAFECAQAITYHMPNLTIWPDSVYSGTTLYNWTDIISLGLVESQISTMEVSTATAATGYAGFNVPRPPGCYYNRRDTQVDSAQPLFFNSDGTNTGSCSREYGCICRQMPQPSPPSPPSLPSPPISPPAPPLSPGVDTVDGVDALMSALTAAAGSSATILLKKSGSPYVLRETFAVSGNLTLVAEFDGEVVIDGSVSGMLFKVLANSGVSLELDLEGLVLTNAYIPVGAAVGVEASASSASSIVRIVRCNIQGNDASAIRVNGAGAKAIVTESLIQDNHGYYGGLYNNGGTMTVTASTIARNRADYHGGALHLMGFQSTTMVRTTVTENSAVDKGGAVYIGGGSLIVQDGSIVRANTLTSSSTALVSATNPCPGCQGSNIFPQGGIVYYKLPGPPGYYLPNAECKVFREPCAANAPQTCSHPDYRAICEINADVAGVTPTLPCPTTREAPQAIADNVTCTGTFTCTARTFIQPCDWQANPELLGSQGLTISNAMDTELPYPCAMGLIGSGRIEDQSSTLCGGLCPVGFYCPNEATTEAVLCPVGSYCPAGSSSPVPCPSGSYSDTPNIGSASECTACPAGSWCATGATEPAPCSAGSASPNISTAECPPCPAGTYQDDSGAVTCKPCRAGSFCKVRSPAPLPCDAGTFSVATDLTSASECMNTSAGHYAPTGSTEQVECAPGTISAGTRSSSCTNCLAGTYQDESGTSSCKACIAGSYCAAGSAAPLPCDAGTFSNATNLGSAAACFDCPPGSACATGSAAPTQCTPGSHAPTSGLDKCVTCPAGNYQDASNAIDCIACDPGDFCPAGASLALAATCEPGTFANVSDADGHPDCFDCLPGYYCAGGGRPMAPCTPGSKAPTTRMTVCDACPAGTRQPDHNATECVACEPGSYCPLGASTALPCLEGTYSATTDLGSAGACTDCPAGSFCPLGSTSAQPCTAGSYSATTRSSRCTLCEAGSYQNQVDTTACIACNAGSFCPAGSTLELPPNCASGTYGNVSDADGHPDCFDCSVGMFCAGGAAQQTQCSAGSYAPTTGMGSCTPCAAGTYQSATGETACLACTAGNYCPLGASAPLSCDAGSYSSATDLTAASECTTTSAGYYASLASSVQTPCAAGTKAATGGLGACTPCEERTYQDQTGRATCKPCIAGSYCAAGSAAPLPCGQGTHSNATDLASVSECTPTSAGYFAPTGSTEQVACAPGTISAGTRSSSCTNCPAGTYQDESGTSSCKACTAGSYCAAGSAAPLPCSAGSFSNATDLGSASECTNTNAGYYAPTGSNQEYACAPGTMAGGTRSSSCTNCPAGQYMPTPGATACLQCDDGYYCAEGSAAPLPCPAGYTKQLGVIMTSTADCVGCPEGTFCPVGAEEATNCSAGTYNPDPNQPLCDRCPQGKYQDDDGMSTCKDCPLGAYCPMGSAMPLTCASGTYQNETGGASCFSCPHGFACRAGATDPLECGVGTTTSVQQDLCVSCPAGQYQDEVRQATCKPCPAGSSCVTGATFPNACSVGSAANGTGNAACSPCLEGTYQDTAGASSCSPCPSGFFCPAGASMAMPASCPPGTYVDGEYSSNDDCVPCPMGSQCAGGGSQPRLCRPGTKSNASGLAICLECDPGSFQEHFNKTECHPCDPGHYCVQGSSTPLPCPGGSTTNPDIAVMTSSADCITCPVGMSCPTGSNAGIPCAPGTNQPQEGQSTCELCEAGKYQGSTQETMCEDCTPGNYCVRGASTPSPCPGGTYANGTGFRSAAQCEPVGPGYWAPTGSPLPKDCPATGFVCPGALDIDSHVEAGIAVPGSEPIIVTSAAGSAAVTDEVTVEVEEQLVTGSLTLAGTEEDFDADAQLTFRTALAAELGIPVSSLVLDVQTGLASGRRQLQSGGGLVVQYTITVPVDAALNNTAALTDTNALAAIGLNVTSAAPPTTQVQSRTETRFVQTVCPQGFWCTAGMKVACEAGFYNPINGSNTQNACIKCPEHSTTIPRVLLGDTIFTFDEATNTTLNSTSESPLGATSLTECVCEYGYYNSFLGVGDNVTCEVCPVGTDCEARGTTLATLNVKPGYYRSSPTSIDVRICTDAGANCDGKMSCAESYSGCAGGADIAILCQEGLTGAFCELCLNATNPAKYYSPADDLKVASCELCDASQAAVILGFLFGCACVVAAFVYISFCLYFRLPEERRKHIATRWKAYGFDTKLKQIIGFYQISTKIGKVYVVNFPSSVSNMFSFWEVAISFGMDVTTPFECLGAHSYESRLEFWLYAPILGVVFIFLAGIAHKKFQIKDGLLWSLPYVFKMMFMIFTIVNLRAFEAFNCHEFNEDPNDSWLIVDVAVQCNTPEHERIMSTAWLAIYIYPVGWTAFTALMLWSIRKSMSGKRRPNEINLALTFVYKDYKPMYYWWEICEMMRRFLLVGYLSNFARGSITQISLATLFCIVYLVIQLQAVPFQRSADGFLAMACTAGLAILFISGIVFKIEFLTDTEEVAGILTPRLKEIFVIPVDMLTFATMGAAIVSLIFAAILVAQESAAEEARKKKEARSARARRLRFADGSEELVAGRQNGVTIDPKGRKNVLGNKTESKLGKKQASALGGRSLSAMKAAKAAAGGKATVINGVHVVPHEEVPAPVIDDGWFHIFLSHVWATGQDQMRIIKQRLQEMIPELRVFLDVDDLEDIGNLEGYIERSAAVLVFCSQGYFQSKNCMRELRSSVQKGKPIVTLMDPDTKKGGLSEEEVKKTLLHGWTDEWGEHKTEEVWESWGFEAGPSPRDLIAALFPVGALKKPIVEWNRIGAFQDVSMRLIAERILTTELRGDAVYIQGEIIHKKQETLGEPRSGRNFHVYCSANNIGAKELMTEVQQARSPALNSLVVTSNINQLALSECMLVYLNSKTWSSGSISSDLAVEIEGAMTRKVRLLLAHEMTGGIHQAERFGCLFEQMFARENGTPAHLIKAGIYAQIAVPLKGQEFRKVSMVLLQHSLLEEPAMLKVDDYIKAARGAHVLPAAAKLPKPSEGMPPMPSPSKNVTESTTAASVSVDDIEMAGVNTDTSPKALPTLGTPVRSPSLPNSPPPSADMRKSRMGSKSTDEPFSARSSSSTRPADDGLASPPRSV